MPNDHGINPHRQDIFCGVDDRFPFGKTASRSGKFHDIRTEPPSGQAEACFGASGVFKEKVGDRLTSQKGYFASCFLRFFENLLAESLGSIKEKENFLFRKGFKS